MDTDHGVILDVAVTSGDVSDAAPYLDQIERVHREVVPIQTATADAIYDFPLANQVLGEHGINFFVRQITHYEPTTVELRRGAFTYDEEKDCYFCPNEKQLRLNTLRRSSSELCQQLQDGIVIRMRIQCLNGKSMSNRLYCPPVHIRVAAKSVPDISTDGLICSSLMAKHFQNLRIN